MLLFQKEDFNDFFVGQCKDFIDYVSKNGCTYKDKRYHCPLTKKDYIFKTHRELDQHIKEVASILINQIFPDKKMKFLEELRPSEVEQVKKHFQDNYPGDFALLKGFDRAFWLMKDFHNEKKLRYMDAKGASDKLKKLKGQLEEKLKKYAESMSDFEKTKVEEDLKILNAKLQAVDSVLPKLEKELKDIESTKEVWDTEREFQGSCPIDPHDIGGTLAKNRRNR